MYHGHPDERADMRRTAMRPIEDDDEDEVNASEMSQNHRKRRARRSPIRMKKPAKKATLSDSDDDKDYDDESEDDDAVSSSSSHRRSPRKQRTTGRRVASTAKRLPKQTAKTFPIVVTTYEIIIRDRVHLEKYSWGFIAVDEGHRLKNFNCKLVQEIKKYPSASRMILTGTPLHVSIIWL
jgi:ATP-dependent DNA helicase